MGILESHFEESAKIIIDHVNGNLLPTDESGKGRLSLLAERFSNIHQNTKYMELANERLKDFEEKIKNLGFSSVETDELAENYKQKLIKFLGSGLKEYLLRNDS